MRIGWIIGQSGGEVCDNKREEERTGGMEGREERGETQRRS